MANRGTGGLGDLGHLKELRQRIFFLLGALIVYRIGTFVPVPGVDPTAFAVLYSQQEGTILDMFNMFSGGALERASLFALGIMPYISASIIMQLMSAVVPSLEQLKKEGEAGRRKITQYTRYGTVVLGVFQSVGIAIALQGQTAGGENVVVNQGIGFVVIATVALVTGTMFLMWLGEQITERGLGNGISIIIFAGIVAGLPSAIGATFERVSSGEMNPLVLIALLIGVIAVTAFVVFVERGQRRIKINYAKRQQGRKMYQAQSSFLPLKLNMSGVIPPIFASSIILFPATLGQMFGSNENMRWLQEISATFSRGEPVYTIAFAAAIIFFCFFYTAIVFNSRETADNLKRSGAFIPGIRPGQQTAHYIDGVLTRLTLVGALYITAVALLPDLLQFQWNIPFYFGGTSLLIIVVVVMDFMAQLQAHLMSHQYESLMKKANFSGVGGAGRIH
ncbi:MAG: preprotein translocase subunit SecY [Gammaproteobacteria bacterium]|jgi:preprotein translocase subunit SecY